jgi:quercetin 2,3-dioxygenase
VDLLAARRPAIERDGIRIDLIAGQAAGRTGPAVTEWPISGAIITLDPGRRLDHLLPGRDRAFLYGPAGDVTIAGRVVTAGRPEQTHGQNRCGELQVQSRPQ